MSELLPERDSIQIEWVMWVNVIELVNLSYIHDEGKESAFRRVHQRITGSDGGVAGFWRKTKENQPAHQDYLDARKRYLFSDGWDLMGACWCRFIRDLDWTKLQTLMNWLYVFRTESFLVVDGIWEECEDTLRKDGTLLEHHFEKRRKKIVSAKAALRRTYNRLSGAGDVVLMIATSEEYCDESIMDAVCGGNVFVDLS